MLLYLQVCDAAQNFTEKQNLWSARFWTSAFHPPVSDSVWLHVMLYLHYLLVCVKANFSEAKRYVTPIELVAENAVEASGGGLSWGTVQLLL